jgi:Sema domain
MQSFEIDDNYCGNHGMNHPVNGTDVISLEAAVTWSGAAVTSLAVTTTDQHTVAFVGTETGVIKKVHLF